MRAPATAAARPYVKVKWIVAPFSRDAERGGGQAKCGTSLIPVINYTLPLMKKIRVKFVKLPCLCKVLISLREMLVHLAERDEYGHEYNFKDRSGDWRCQNFFRFGRFDDVACGWGSIERENAFKMIVFVLHDASGEPFQLKGRRLAAHI